MVRVPSTALGCRCPVLIGRSFDRRGASLGRRLSRHRPPPASKTVVNDGNLSSPNSLSLLRAKRQDIPQVRLLLVRTDSACLGGANMCRHTAMLSVLPTPRRGFDMQRALSQGKNQAPASWMPLRSLSHTPPTSPAQTPSHQNSCTLALSMMTLLQGHCCASEGSKSNRPLGEPKGA